MVEYIKEYLLQCPLFKDIEDDIGIDYQEEQPDSYSINTIPEQRLISQDIIGNKNMQFSFTVTSRAYTATDLNRIENLNLFERFADWVNNQNENGNLPQLGENQVATELVITNNGYLYSNNPDIQNGVYQIQLKLYYIEKMKEVL